MGMTELETATKFDQYEIIIEPNPDHWRGGFAWSVGIDTEELGSGLEFSEKLARQEAQSFIINLLREN